MPIWKHILEDLAALVSLVVMPYVLIAVGLGVAFFVTKHPRSIQRIEKSRKSV